MKKARRTTHKQFNQVLKIIGLAGVVFCFFGSLVWATPAKAQKGGSIPKNAFRSEQKTISPSSENKISFPSLKFQNLFNTQISPSTTLRVNDGQGRTISTDRKKQIGAYSTNGNLRPFALNIKFPLPGLNIANFNKPAFLNKSVFNSIMISPSGKREDSVNLIQKNILRNVNGIGQYPKLRSINVVNIRKLSIAQISPSTTLRANGEQSRTISTDIPRRNLRSSVQKEIFLVSRIPAAANKLVPTHQSNNILSQLPKIQKTTIAKPNAPKIQQAVRTGGLVALPRLSQKSPENNIFVFKSQYSPINLPLNLKQARPRNPNKNSNSPIDKETPKEQPLPLAPKTNTAPMVPAPMPNSQAGNSGGGIFIYKGLNPGLLINLVKAKLPIYNIGFTQTEETLKDIFGIGTSQNNRASIA